MPIVIARWSLRAGAVLAAAGLALALSPAALAPTGATVDARPAAAPSAGGRSFVGSSTAVQPVAWCGQDEVAANRSPEVEVSSGNQIRVVYAVPTDRPDRFPSLASPIATDVSAIDQWWQRKDPSRTPRFDLYPFPGCGSRFGMLDIGVVRLPAASASYQGEDGFTRLTDDVAALTPGDVKTLAFYDGPHGGNICGEAWTAPFLGGTRGVAIAYLETPPGCGQDLGTGGGLASTAAHELTHALGAVPPAAPNGCDGHACDSSADLMWATAVPGRDALSGKILDVNRDDYYGHSGAWWDVQDSNWLMHLPQFPLTVSVVGRGGAGTVGSQPETLSCPTACSAVWDNGTLVSLVAQPADGSRLVGLVGRLLRSRRVRRDDGRRQVGDRHVRPGLVQDRGHREGQGPRQERPEGDLLHRGLLTAVPG